MNTRQAAGVLEDSDTQHVGSGLASGNSPFDSQESDMPESPDHPTTRIDNAVAGQTPPGPAALRAREPHVAHFSIAGKGVGV